METDPITPPAARPIPTKKKRSKRTRIIIGVGVVVLIAFTYWFIHRHELTTDDAAIEAQVVPMAPKVSGYVVALNVTDNSEVKAGDVIAEIDPRDYQIALDKAKADLASAEARAASSQKNYASTQVTAPLTVASAQAMVDSAQADWVRTKQELARLTKLSNAARSRTEYETAFAAEKAAESNYADAVAKLKSAQTAPNTVASAAASVKDVQGAVLMQRALVAQAQKNLDDTKIIAPIDGRVSKRNIELGMYLQSGQQIFSLVSQDYWVVANYKETQLTNMRPGQKVTINIDSYPGIDYKGHVDSIQLGTGARFSVFPPENATGNFVKIVQRVPVKLVFDDKPDASLPIGPGMSVSPIVFTK